MLKALIKKQFFECFRTYFVNAKTGKARSKGSIVGMFTFFTLLMLVLCLVFFSVALAMGDLLLTADLAWMYFSIMSLLAIALGTFGSVFNTFSSLYLAKDNDLLLSMPIPASHILISRMALVYGLSLLYSGLVWLPTLVYHWLFGSPTPVSVVFGILLEFVISLLVTVLTCALGWVVAQVSARVKNKSFIVVILCLAFFAGYYYVCMNMMDFLNGILMNSEAVGNSLRTWGFLIYALGQAAAGNALYMLLFTAITAVLFALCFTLLSRSFIRMVTRTPVTAKVPEKAAGTITAGKTRSVKSALFHRELKRFTSSPTYMLNCGLGLVLLPILTIAALVKRGQLQELLPALTAEMPELLPFLPLSVLTVVCLITAMNTISTPSISLEGKNLWILRSLPVSAADMLQAKLNLHIRLNLYPAVICSLILCCCLQMGTAETILIIGLTAMFVRFTGAFGLMLGVKRPNFTWTSESMPVKQSLNSFLALLVGWVIPFLITGLFYPLRNTVSVTVYLAVWVVIITAASLALDRWLETRGAACIEAM